MERDSSGTLTSISISPTHNKSYPRDSVSTADISSLPEVGDASIEIAAPSSSQVELTDTTSKMKDLKIALPESMSRPMKKTIVKEDHVTKFSLPLASIESGDFL